ncbi:MAG: aminotransferase class III-fold pyridoxal phosphate-dependent enzyme, partial [Spirochaetota bacterium]
MLQKIIPKFNLDFCGADNPPLEILNKRKDSIKKFHRNIDKEAEETSMLDDSFASFYRIPFPYTEKLASFQQNSLLKNKDTSKYDAFSSYGVNVFGREVYDTCIKQAVANYDEYGFFLNSVHPITLENIRYLKKISGLDSFSFHMSGTEAVLNACRLAKLNTGKKYILKFKGAYHGWASIPNLKEIKTIGQLKRSRNCAALLVNPLQILFPIGSLKADAALLLGNSTTPSSREEYSKRLQEIQQICQEKGIIFILDEVFLGFRLAYGGCQEYFNTRADMVLYGKTLGGGLPVGVVCGKEKYMQKFSKQHPLNFLPSRGTFAAHPLVMLSMNQFLKYLQPNMYDNLDSLWNARRETLNQKLQDAELPLEFINLASIFGIRHHNYSIYNWVLQLYFKKNNLYLGP